MQKFPQIKGRYVPPVCGRDLEQSLNYADSGGIPLRWFYESFTYPQVFYRRGSRPRLEKFLARKKVTGKPGLATLERCVNALVKQMNHYVELDFEGVGNRGGSEEELLFSGHGWCNEQARVLVALTQILGMPSRLVFAGMRSKKGHVVAEVFVGGKWVLVDQTANHVFKRKDGTPVNVLDIKTSRRAATEAGRGFKAALDAGRKAAVSKKIWDRHVAWMDKPLDLFWQVGYCNYFIH